MKRDYSEMLSALLAEGVEFLVVGAFAVNAYGLLRSTVDMDVWVRPSTENALRVLRALRRFGAPTPGVTEEDFAKEGTVFQIGVDPVRIDVMTYVSGVEFEEAWRDRTTYRWDDLDVPVIGRVHLLRNKKATGRAKDAGDIDWLERHP